MDMLKTGKLIGQRRTQLGLTQAELAQRLGVTVLPPSRFQKQDVLTAAGAGSLLMPPHSLVLLRFAPDT